KGSVLVRCVLGDGEGLAFAKQVADVLRAAGWTVGDVSQGVYSGTNPVGFGIVIRSKQAPPPGAEVLFKALTRAGLPIGVAEEVGIPADRIAVTVGNKPSELKSDDDSAALPTRRSPPPLTAKGPRP